MSDFSEICPLFATGVMGEVCFPFIVNLTALSTTANALEGTITAGTGAGVFTFGRTVVVTDCFIRRYAPTAAASNTAQETMRLRHRSSAGATPTNFGAATVTNTLSIYTEHTYWPMTLIDTTFTSNAVLDFGYGTVTETAIGAYDLIVQYKEA